MQCWTPPPSNTPMAQNDDGRTAKMTTATARSSAYEAKTEIYDGISKYTKSKSGCSPSKTND